MRKISLLCLVLFSYCCFAETKEIAITIDDLPLVGSKMNTPGNQQRATDRFLRIIQALRENNVPATGFVIAGAIEKGQWAFLEQFHDAGFVIGNHTYSHANLNHMNAEKYIADIDRADKILTPLYTGQKYFRYPYLAEGNSQNKQKVKDYLAAHHYVIAPVTIDSKDFRFNEQLYKVPYRARENYISKLKSQYLAYIWKATVHAENRAKGQPVKQILLLHANCLNSYVLGDILQMYKEHGYKFITLAEALENPAPQIIAPVASETSPEAAQESK